MFKRVWDAFVALVTSRVACLVVVCEQVEPRNTAVGWKRHNGSAIFPSVPYRFTVEKRDRLNHPNRKGGSPPINTPRRVPVEYHAVRQKIRQESRVYARANVDSGATGTRYRHERLLRVTIRITTKVRVPAHATHRHASHGPSRRHRVSASQQ